MASGLLGTGIPLTIVCSTGTSTMVSTVPTVRSEAIDHEMTKAGGFAAGFVVEWAI